MKDPVLPDGDFLFAVRAVRRTFGGRTMAMLMRSRLFAAEGVPSRILTFDPYEDYTGEVQALRDNGKLVDGVEILNIYDYYRAHGWGDEGSGQRELPEIRDCETIQEHYADGSPWRITYQGKTTVHDYQRPDGSIYLRAPSGLLSMTDLGRGKVTRVGTHGGVLGSFKDAREWLQGWVREVARSDQDVFLMLEDFFLSHLLSPMPDPRVHQIVSVHVPHTNAPRRWDSNLNRKAANTLERLSDVDAVVLLTDRQRDDLVARYGQRSHLYTIPNPVEIPDAPEPPVTRDPARFVVLARLDPGKRIEQTIEAFGRARQDAPSAQLDIFGGGPERTNLESLIKRSNLSECVTMHGHDPDARDQLWKATAMVLTTAYEGLPLVVLEAMSRACPVISYDIKYGPRELLADTGAGRVVPDGDVSAVAAAMKELVRDHQLVERLGRAGRNGARGYTADVVMRLWGDMLRDVVRQRPRRLRLHEAGFDLQRAELVDKQEQASGAIRRILTRWTAAKQWKTLDVEGTLHFDVRGADGWEDDIVISVKAVDTATGHCTPLAVKVQRLSSQTFRVEAIGDLGSLVRDAAEVRTLRLHLTVACRNEGWDTYLGLPSGRGPVQELSFDKAGLLSLRVGTEQQE